MREEALRSLARARGWLDGPGPPGAADAALGEALVAAGFLNDQQRRELLRILPRTPFVCQTCRGAVLGQEFASQGPWCCPRCGGQDLIPPGGAPSALGSGNGAFSDQPRADGRTLGGYLLEGELGRGNFGVVFLARKPGLERRFALKVTDGRFAQQSEIERFRLEAQVASKLQHRGIVGVFDVGEEGGRYFYAMEFVDGPTLKDHLEDCAPLLAAEAAELLEQLADTMHHAHERRVIHRDLKPANVLLDRQDAGRPRVMDFGLARDRTSLLRLTQTGEVVGSPFYMAPEQLRGKQVDPRADVYSLGVILYEALTGRRPYEGANMHELDAAIASQAAPTPRQLNPAVPEALERICLVALAQSPDERYMSARALAEDLGAFRRGEEPSHASGLRPAAQGGRPAWGLLAAALALLAVVAGGALVLRARPPGPGPAPTLSPTPAGPAPSPSASPSATPAGSAPQAQTPLERARDEARRRAPWDLVGPTFLRALEAAPEDGELRLEVVGLLRRRGRYGEALALLAPLAGRGDALELRARRFQGELHEARGELNEARAAYAAVAEGPDPGLAALGRASLRRLEGDLPGALEAAQRAFSSQTEPAAAARELAYQTRQRDLTQPPSGEHVEARTRLETLEPDHPLVAYLEARACLMERDFGEALRQTRAALVLLAPGEDPILLELLLNLLLVTQQTEEALDVSLRLIDLAPTARSYVDRGRVLYLRGEEDWTRLAWKEQAVAAWRRGFKVDPDGFHRTVEDLFPGPMQGFVLAMAESPSAPKLWQRYRPGDRIPELQMRMEARAALASPAGREPLLRALLDAAVLAPAASLVEAFGRARTAAPRDPVVALEWLRCVVGRELFTRQEEAVAAARALDVDEREIELLEADALGQRGKRHLAAPRWEALARERQDDRVGRLALARLWLAHSDAARALPAAQAAVEALPGDPEAHRALAYALLLESGGRQAHRANELMLESFARGGGLNAGTLLALLSIGEIQLVMTPEGQQRRVQRQEVDQLLDAYERALPASAGVSLHVSAASFVTQLPPEAKHLERALRWIKEAQERQSDRGDVFLLEGALRLNQGASREEVLALWGRALEVEPRLQFSPTMLQTFEKKHGREGLERFRERSREE